MSAPTGRGHSGVVAHIPVAEDTDRPMSAHAPPRALVSILLIVCAACRQPAGPDTESSSIGDAPPTASEESIIDTGRPSPRDDDWFADVTSASGVDSSYSTGRDAGRFTILETVGGGLGLFDYDLDGNADLFGVGGGTIDSGTAHAGGVPASLYRHLASLRFADVSAAAQLPPVTHYSHGCTAGDVNSDGFPDLFLTCYGRSRLWLNLGDGTWSDATASLNQSEDAWSVAAAFADVDRDGHLDLFVANYLDWRPDPEEWCGDRSREVQDVCPPQRYEPVADRLFVNSGDGQFIDRSEAYGIRKDGMGLGVVAADLNGDARADLYVANDVVANHLYLSQEDGTLREAAEPAGVAYNQAGTPEGSMGIDAADVDGDGLPELWVTNFELEDNSLYRNLGEGAFQHATFSAGLGGRSRGMVGFGTGLHDFDSDGWPDLYVLNGHVLYHTGHFPFRQPAFVYRNREGRFEDVTESAGPWFSIPHAARGGAVSDLNGDGAPDLAVSSLDEPLVLLANRRPAANWIRLKLVGAAGPRQPVGASVAVTAFGRTRTQFVTSGAGFCSQSDLRLLFALGEDEDAVDATVHWPSGRRERFTALPPRTDCVMIEGHGQAED